MKRISQKLILFLFFPLLMSCIKDVEILPTISIGVFSGSIAYRPESNISKSYWEKELDARVTTYAVGSAGFCDVRNNTILMQAESSSYQDCFILWCSTNDYGQPIESEDKYSPKSQAGGMRIVIEFLQNKFPNSLIVAFTSLPSKDGRDLTLYVENQKKVFKEYNIPYLDQFHFFDNVKNDKIYKSDFVHLTTDGYEFIKTRQVNFLKNVLVEWQKTKLANTKTKKT